MMLRYPIILVLLFALALPARAAVTDYYMAQDWEVYCRIPDGTDQPPDRCFMRRMFKTDNNLSLTFSFSVARTKTDMPVHNFQVEIEDDSGKDPISLTPVSVQLGDNPPYSQRGDSPTHMFWGKTMQFAKELSASSAMNVVYKDKAGKEQVTTLALTGVKDAGFEFQKLIMKYFAAQSVPKDAEGGKENK